MFQRPAFELIKERYSCRSFDGKPIPEEKLLTLREFVESQDAGPFATRPRFGLVAAQAGDDSMIKGLSTYGFIKQPSAFLVGAGGRTEDDLVDFGFLTELAVLKATELGLGSCWLGGTFRRSRFAAAVGLDARLDESDGPKTVICVIALGNFPSDKDPRHGFIRNRAGGAHRKAPETLFFDESWGNPLALPVERIDGELLEAVRLGPSASNKQPWRIVVPSTSKKEHPKAHLYLQRTPGYHGIMPRLAKVADIQVVDMGIALAHLSSVAADHGWPAGIVRRNPSLAVPDSQVKYIATLNG